jgi:hypothetical protein
MHGSIRLLSRRCPLTIAVFSILLNAIIAVLLVIYGIWFKYIVRHQLDSKDAAIQALQTAIAAKDAVIQQLEGEKAPAIAQNYKIMKEHANEITEMNMQLKVRMDKISADNAELKDMGLKLARWAKRKKDVGPMTKLRDEAKGLMIAYHMLIDAAFPESVCESQPASTEQEAIRLYEVIIESVHKAFDTLKLEIETRIKDVNRLMQEVEDKMEPTEKAEYHEWKKSDSLE